MKKTCIIAIMAIGYLFGSLPFVQGEEKKFPNRPIEMIVPFPPGGTADIAARIVIDQLSKELKIPVTVVYKPGASGTIGANVVAKGKPDGHILLTGNAACMTIPYFFLKSVPFDAQKDFIPLAYGGESPSVLAVQSASPFRTFEEMLNFARKNPGKLSYDTSGGLSSAATLNMEVVKSQAGADIATVVYEGGGPSLAAILGGHVDIIASSVPVLGPQIEAGKLRILVSNRRMEEMPNVPTLAEKGFPMVLTWTAFFAPAKIPKGTYDTLARAFDKALGNPAVIKRLKEAGYVPERKTPAQISETLKQQYSLVSRIIKETKVKN